MTIEIIAVTLLLFGLAGGGTTGVQAQEKRMEIAPVLSHFPVGFSLLTHGDNQFAAYYDPDHNMTVASRRLDEETWTYRVLPSKIKWDSHNYIVMAVDRDGYLHLSGNMHAQPLVYFRTAKPMDITSFEQIGSMTGQQENRMTYPHFMEGPDKALIYHYRDGGSGNGNEIYNVYDPGTKTWSRLLDTPLMDGRGEMNSYMSGPSPGPDGYYHLVWVWRDTYHCETNHHLSYARSRDLRNWESAAGEPVSLPITVAESRLWVDPVPPMGGIINGAAKMGFDSRHNLLITYHKFDDEGNTQAYIARFGNGSWQIEPLSRWDYRWYFSGGGSINFEVRIQAAKPVGNGKLRIGYDHIQYGAGYWTVDENTLAVLETVRTGESEANIPSQGPSPEALVKTKRSAGDSGHRPSGVIYSLEWETLPANRDTLRTGIGITPSMLYLLERKR